jgi:hypothetical protein
MADTFRTVGAFEPVDQGEEDVVDAAVLELVHDPQPEPFGFVKGRLGALALLDLHAQALKGPGVTHLSPQRRSSEASSCTPLYTIGVIPTTVIYQSRYPLSLNVSGWLSIWTIIW